MSAQQVTLTALYKLIKERFEIRWEFGKEFGAENLLTHISWGNHPEIIGYMNTIRPFIIQMLGQKEIDHLDQLSQSERESLLASINTEQTKALIVSDNCSISHDIKEACEKYNTALFRCKANSEQLLTDLRYRLSQQFSEKRIMHGVFMEINSVGLLIQGKSKLGKSELALELINRGHRLIADDAPEFSRITPDIVSGKCPPVLQDLLEVRGLGVLNIRKMYGDIAIKDSKYLRLIVRLFHQDDDTPEEPRLQSNIQIRDVLGIQVPEVAIRVAPGRNIAIMIEAAVQNHLLFLQGYDSNATFIERQQRFINDPNSSE